MRLLCILATPARHPPCLAGMSGWHTHGLLGLPAAESTSGKGRQEGARELPKSTLPPLPGPSMGPCCLGN